MQTYSEEVIPDPWEPGQRCTEPGCEGKVDTWWEVIGEQPDGCYCHSSPPCNACVTAPLVCDTCKTEYPVE